MSMDLMSAEKQIKKINEDSQVEKTKRKVTLKIFNSVTLHATMTWHKDVILTDDKRHD